MGWKECNAMDERIRFVVRALEGETVSSLCREFGISRKTGHKMLNRYRDYGVEALRDQKRQPLRNANKLPYQIEEIILNLKEEKPDWGARKIREILIRKYPDIKPPAKSTVHAVLERNGKVSRRGRARQRATGTPLSEPHSANDLWCADFKGQFRLGNHKYCYPLTLTDSATRYLLACEALDSVCEKHVFTVFEEVFKQRGLPLAIRTDNGVPFASPRGLFGLSRLSVWWLTLGIAIERIKPGNPQQNGRHERMHRTLKKGTTKPAGTNLLQQQEKFNRFIDEFNNERPHESLQMKYPSECYTPSKRNYKDTLPIDYPMHDAVAKVFDSGYFSFNGHRVYLSRALAGSSVGISEQDDGIWLVSFMNYDLGFFDTESEKFEQGQNPFGLQV